MLQDLNREDRMTLMRFVCSFAWADLDIAPGERALVAQFMEQLNLEADEKELVADWLSYPPAPEEVDPTQIPREHRALFLNAIQKMVEADGVIDEEERVNLALFKLLLVDD
jgi:uncharacterized tellurite resistance protein B-like protein